MCNAPAFSCIHHHVSLVHGAKHLAVSSQGSVISSAHACRFDGVTAYQTDWSIAAVTLHAQGSPLQPEGDQPFNLPMASLEGQPGIALHFSTL